MFFSIHP